MFWMVFIVALTWGLYKLLIKVIYILKALWLAIISPILNLMNFILYHSSQFPFLHDSNVVKFLLKFGADVNCVRGQHTFNTPLKRVIRLAHNRNVLDLFKEHGGNLRWTNSEGVTLLHLAAQECNLVSIGFLVRNDVSVDDRNNTLERSPLMFAASAVTRPNLDVIGALSALKEQGANVHLVDINGDNILHHASKQFAMSSGYDSAAFKNKVKKVIQFAMENGIDLNRRNNLGQTPWEGAMMIFRSVNASSIRRNDTVESQLESQLESLLRVRALVRNIGFEPLVSPHFCGPVYPPTLPSSMESSVLPSAPSIDELDDLPDTNGEPTEMTFRDDAIRGSDHSGRSGGAESKDDSKECCICLDKTPDTVLIPCGHFVCDDCAQSLRVCPLCRKSVERTLRTYR